MGDFKGRQHRQDCLPGNWAKGRVTVADRLKVLIVAPNASSMFGGEAFLPLRYFDLLCDRGHFVRMITHARNRDSLTESFPHLGDRVDYIEDSAAHRLVWAIGSRFPARLRDVTTGLFLTAMTEFAQAKMIRRLIAKGEVDPGVPKAAVAGVRIWRACGHRADEWRHDLSQRLCRF
jgi:hypothetical protein